MLKFILVIALTASITNAIRREVQEDYRRAMNSLWAGMVIILAMVVVS